nr:hypothetical protein [Tanacetum cinerariifolium]
MSWYNHHGCSCCGSSFNGENCPGCNSLGSGNEFIYEPNPNSFDNPPDFPYQSPQHQYETNSCEFCGNDAHYGYDCPPQELVEYINTLSWNHPAFYNNGEDDDEDYTIAITLDFPITKFLIMRDEHLDTIPEKESDKFIKSSVENLVPNPSESEDLSDIERECDVPVCNNFTTYSNSLFDADNDFSSSDDESFFDENVSKEIYSNLFFDEEIISIKIDPHHFNAEFDLIESFLNQGSSIISYPKFDSLLEEFSGELAHIDLIPQEINESDFDPEEEIHLDERLLYDNSSPRPLKDFNFENSYVIIKSFSPSPIPI